jgi:hypothetical protein
MRFYTLIVKIRKEADMADTRAPAYYEYIIVESGGVVEEEWKLVGVYGSRFFNWMVFQRYIPEEKVAK